MCEAVALVLRRAVYMAVMVAIRFNPPLRLLLETVLTGEEQRSPSSQS